MHRRTVLRLTFGCGALLAGANAASSWDPEAELQLPRHHTSILESPLRDEVGDTWCETRTVHPPFAFSELLVSWNVTRAPGAAFLVEIQVTDSEGVESPWLEIGSFGDVPRDRPRSLEFEDGRIDIDWFRAKSEVEFVATVARVRSLRGNCKVERIAFCFTNRRVGSSRAAAPALSPIALRVPFFSQQSAEESKRSRICSPTSVSMVLAHRGVDLPPEDVAARVFDVENDVYGNWPRSIQTAFEAGCPGYLTRFSDWSDVARLLAADQPVIASIGVEPGELTGAPYAATKGHLIVLRGIDSNGDVLVNDPAASDAASGQRVYLRAELDVVWMQRGGTAYVIEPKRASTGGS